MKISKPLTVILTLTEFLILYSWHCGMHPYFPLHGKGSQCQLPLWFKCGPISLDPAMWNPLMLTQ